MDLTKQRKKIDSLLSDFKLAKKQVKQEKERLAELQTALKDAEQAQLIAQEVAQQIQQQAHTRIANVVTRCLETVFEDDYGFKIEFERKRGRTEAKLILLKDGHEIPDPLNADSGGVVDVAAFALRVSGIVLTKPKLRPFLAMDEPFKFVSREYRDNVRMMIEGLARDFNFQFVMVTHVTELQTGKVVEL